MPRPFSQEVTASESLLFIMATIDPRDGDGAALQRAETGGAKACPSAPCPTPCCTRSFWNGEEKWRRGKEEGKNDRSRERVRDGLRTGSAAARAEILLVRRSSANAEVIQRTSSSSSPGPSDANAKLKVDERFLFPACSRSPRS